MWDYIKKVGAALFSPKQTAQAAVKEAIKEPLQEAAQAAAIAATNTAKQAAKPLVAELVNDAIDAAKTRLVKEGEALATNTAKQAKGLLQVQADAATSSVKQKADKTSNSLVSGIARKVISPFAIVAGNIFPHLKSKAKALNNKVVKSTKSLAKSFGNQLTAFTSGLFNTVVGYLAKSVLHAVNSMVASIFAMFGVKTNNTPAKNSKNGSTESSGSEPRPLAKKSAGHGLRASKGIFRLKPRISGRRPAVADSDAADSRPRRAARAG